MFGKEYFIKSFKFGKFYEDGYFVFVVIRLISEKIYDY